MTRVVSPATEADARELAATMRPDDVLEVAAADGSAPLESIIDSMRSSDVALALRVDGEVLAIWGVGPYEPDSSIAGGSDIGTPWLLTGSGVERHRRDFVRVCKEQLPAILDAYPLLINFIDGRHERALRWALWAGFQLCPPIPYGPEQRPFIPIVRRAPCAPSFQ